MSKLLTASIGKKLIMSLSGLFLMLFILVHLTANILLIFDDTGALYNTGAHFMETNPVIRVVEPLLGLGFMVHILWSLAISWENWRARPVRYAKVNSGISSSWASRNMLILGALILVFMVIHILDFYWIIRFVPDKMPQVTINGKLVDDTYSLVSHLFITSLTYSILYIVGAILLGLHLTHGFWSSFQTLGLNNKIWMKRLEWVAKIYAIIVAVGFSVIPLYFQLKF